MNFTIISNGGSVFPVIAESIDKAHAVGSKDFEVLAILDGHHRSSILQAPTGEKFLHLTTPANDASPQ